MTVSTPLAACPIAHAPLATRPIAPLDVSHPHVVSRPGQAKGMSASSSTPLPSHPHDTSHVSHPHIAPYPMQSCALSTPPPMLPTSHSNVDILHTALSLPPQIASHVPPPPVASRPKQACGSSHPTSTPPPSRSMAHPTAAGSLPPRRKCLRRCFVCGGTGKHHLNPRFCPRTYKLLSKHLAMFDATFHLVSFNGSPLPMTRHPGGVAAHLLSPRRFLPCTTCALPRIPSTLPSTSKSNSLHLVIPATVPLRTVEPSSDSNPPHVGVAATICPRTVDPNVDLNPPHTSHPSAVLPRPISGLDRSIESSLPHFLPVERLPSPPIYLPIRIPQPDSKPIADPPQDDSSPHVTLSIFEILFISPSVRTEL